MNNNQENYNFNSQINNNFNQPIQQNNTNRFFNSPPQQNVQIQLTQEQTNPSINVIPTLGETIQPNLMNDLIKNDQPVQQVNNIPQNINSINTNIITNIKPQDINSLNQTQNKQPTQVKHNGYSEENDEIKIESTNRFINIEQEENNHQLNIDKELENNTSKYENDATVQKNIEKVKKKNTITITGEMKTILLIFIVLFIFIVVMPYIFDFLGTL